MNSSNPDAWPEANQAYLTAALALLRAQLANYLSRQQNETTTADEEAAQQTLAASATALPAPAAIETLCAIFALSPFERDLLLLCAGVELEARFAPLCAVAHGDPARPYPTFSLALAALHEPHWSALLPDAPLRRWRLLDVGAGNALTVSPLRIDERILHYLCGLHHLDERLVGLVTPVYAVGDLTPSHSALAEQLALHWSQPTWDGRSAAVLLCGDQPADKTAIAAEACMILGWSLYALAAHRVPSHGSELEALLRLWEREAALSGSALLLDCDEVGAGEGVREHALADLIEQANFPLVVCSRERRRTKRALVTLDVARPSAAEQRALWQGALADLNLNGQVDALVAQFNLSASAIEAACANTAGETPAALGAALWESCRAQARPRLDDLAQRIDSATTWEDLVLPDGQMETLHAIAAQVKQRATVYEQWGFAAKSGRGLGISALFAGPSGTGKTLAAEVLANELHLDLYRIDLSQTVSKYIGETEKNLRRVFDAAEAGSAVLLFDEADALFGKRSEVKDSHDRYANIEVSYLLQRMEAYRGLAILTTNMKGALDPAFLRRIRFVVQFPFPDVALRTAIWQRIFPAETPTAGLDLARLARLNVVGGNIRNIALGAAFLAADEGSPVGMGHLLRAARSECAKMEKPLSEAEVAGWM
jgi:hypothetical protein